MSPSEKCSVWSSLLPWLFALYSSQPGWAINRIHLPASTARYFLTFPLVRAGGIPVPTALRTAQARISMRTVSSGPVSTIPALSSSSRPTIESQSWTRGGRKLKDLLQLEICSMRQGEKRGSREMRERGK